MAARLLYATPTGKHPHIGYVKTVRDMELGCKSFARGVWDFIFAVGPVQMARAFIADTALEKGYDFLVMHDDDLMVEASHPELGNMLDEWHGMMDRNPEIGLIGAVYMRERPMVPTVTVKHDMYPGEICHVVSGFGPTPVEVATIGTGFVMIRREALLAVRDELPMFRFSHRRTQWGTSTMVGEDYDFCNRLRAKGFTVVADPRFATVHCKDGAHLPFKQSEYEYNWSDECPTVLERASELRSQTGPLMTLRHIGGFVCIDHTPQLIAEANEKVHKNVIDSIRAAADAATSAPPKAEAAHAAW